MVAQSLEVSSETVRRNVAEATSVSAVAEGWDRFVETTPGGDLVQTTAWTETKRALGFEVCPVISFRGGGIGGGAQMVIKRFGPLGGVGIVARGPLLAGVSVARAGEVLDEIEHEARARRVRHLIIQPPEGTPEIEAALVARGYEGDAPGIGPIATLRIDLSQSPERIIGGMATSRRGQVRRVERLGIDVRLAARDDVDIFCAMHEATARRQRFTALARAYLYHQWEALHPRGYLRLFLAYHEGRPLAGIWVTAFRDTVTYRVPGWTGEARNLQLNVACHWRAMRWAKDRGYRYYDFGGVDRRFAEQAPGRELMSDELRRSATSFKASFGGERVLLPMARQLTFNPWARPVVRLLSAQVARRRSLREFVHRLRNG